MGNVLEGTAADWREGPAAPDPYTPGPRKSLGPGYDWLLELGRQIYRPALGAITLGGLFRVWVLGATMDELALGLLVTLAMTFAGFRTAEMVMTHMNRAR